MRKVDLIRVTFYVLIWIRGDGIAQKERNANIAIILRKHDASKLLKICLAEQSYQVENNDGA